MTIEHPLKIYEKLDPELLKFVENSSDFVSPAPTPAAQASQEAHIEAVDRFPYSDSSISRRFRRINNKEQPFAQQEDGASPDCSVCVNANLWFPAEAC